MVFLLFFRSLAIFYRPSAVASTTFPATLRLRGVFGIIGGVPAFRRGTREHTAVPKPEFSPIRLQSTVFVLQSMYI